MPTKYRPAVVSRDSGVRKGSVTGDTLPRMRRVAPLALVLVLGAALRRRRIQPPRASRSAGDERVDAVSRRRAAPTTVSPNGDGFRDAAHVQFRLAAPARVALTVIQTDTAKSDPEASAANVVQRLRPRAFAPGAHELVWTPRRESRRGRTCSS